MKKLRWIRAVVTVALLTAGVVSAHANQLADIKQKGELVCGVLGNAEPFSFISDQSTREIVGYDVDLCKAIAKAIGVKVSLKQVAVAARLPELMQGRVDILAAALTHTRERESQIDFSYSTFLNGQKVMVRKDSAISQLQQLASKKVLTIKGSTMEENMRKALPSVQIVSLDNGAQAFLALQQGKGMGYVNDESTLMNDLVKLGEGASDYVILPQRISTEHLALGIRKDEPEFRGLVNKLLSDMEVSGEAEKLFMKWFGPGTRLKFQSRSFKISTDKID